MAVLSIGDYSIRMQEGESAPRMADLRGPSVLVEEYGVAGDDAGICYLSVGRGLEFPFLEVLQRYSPSGVGLPVGILLIPESHRLYIGAGTRLLAYDLTQPSRLWMDEVASGFWFWSRHGSVVLMGAELELSAWDIWGRRLWSASVEPPWDIAVANDVITLDVMGTVSRVRLQTGN